MKSIKNIKKTDQQDVEMLHSFLFGMSVAPIKGFSKIFLDEIVDILRKVIIGNKWQTEKQLSEFEAKIFADAELNKNKLIEISKGALNEVDKLPSAKINFD